jgi:hypothetical protein
MKTRNLLPVLLFGTCTLSLGLTEAEKKATDELISALKEESKAIDDSDPDSSRSQNIRMILRQIQSAANKGSDVYLEQTLDNIEVNPRSEKSNACLANLREELRKNRTQQVQKTIDRLEALLKSISEKCLSATSPEELDDLLNELSVRQSYEYDDNRGIDPEKQQKIRQLINRLSYSKSFVSNWQSYLQAKKTGNTSAAVQALQSISNSENSYIPRSQLLDRIEKEKSDPEKIPAVIENIRGLPDMQAALAKIIEIQKQARNSDSYTSHTELVQSLGRLEKTYREFLAGLPVNVDIFRPSTDTSSYSPATPKFVELRAELLKLVLPTYLNLPKGSTAKPGESIPEFLERLQSEARTSGDMALCQRIIDFDKLQSRSNSFNTNDTNALQDYNAAQNQIQAGQYFLAALSLQRALSYGSDLLPNSRIGEQLASIQKDHPQDYEKAVAEFLIPKPKYQEYPFGFPRMPDYYRGRYPDGDPRNPSGPSVSLPIPPRESATPAQKPEAAPKPAAPPAESSKKPSVEPATGQ